MIIPSRPPSPDQDPPPYQESQRLPSERPTTSLYAPPISSRSNPPREREKELEADPDGATETTSLVPPPPPPKEKEDPSQIGDTIPTASASSSSRSPDPASTSHTSPTQDPLNPAPDAFTRPTANDYEYSPFQPMTMLGISSNLADGFPMTPPPILNFEDETSTGKGPGPQHPFVSHDVTEDDWLKFLAGLKTVASTPNQAQRSFLARMFLGEMNEKDQRKRAIHFVNSWNHYFFQPRRMTVVLARGRKVFGAADYHHRRHSISVDRGRDSDPTQTRDRHRSRSTDSSSSRLSARSARSTVSEPPEMPASHIHEPSSEKALTEGPSSTPEQQRKTYVSSAVNDGLSDLRHGVNDGLYNFHQGLNEGLFNLQQGLNEGLYHLHRGLNEGFYHVNNGLRSAFGGPGFSKAPQIAGPGGGEPSRSPTDRDSKEAWKSQLDQWKVQQDEWKQEQKAEQKAPKPQERGVKPERKLTKEISKDERQQLKLEGKGKSRDQPWKLIIFYHGARGENGHS